MMPKLYLLLLTYSDSLESARTQYAEKTLRSALDNLKYSGPLSVHIADDGSPEEHRQKLADIAGGYERVQGVTVTNAQRSGYGASYNLATQVVHNWADVVLPLEDDWELTQPLDADSMVQTLMETPIECIRRGYLGFTQELRGVLGHAFGSTYLVMDPDSPEPHVNAGHPRLETVRYERSVGPWTEGINPGATEFSWCVRRAAREGVAWHMGAPLDGHFKHVGTVQARADQR
jgi:hypothetical protein